MVIFIQYTFLHPKFYFANINDFNQKQIQEYEIPLSLFATGNGQRFDTQYGSLMWACVVVRDTINKDFLFELKGINLFNNPEFNKISEKYKKNIMFKRKNSYKIEGLDTGRSIFRI